MQLGTRSIDRRRTPLIIGIALFGIALALRGASVNSLIRRRLLTAGVLFALYALAAALLARARLSADVAAQLATLSPLLLAFGVASLVVVVAINPWREDRLPDRFPTIVQDAIIIVLFALIAILFMPEKILATTAVGAVVIGFALQDTLGNLFSGLAIQIEKPFRVGHWVTIAGTDGLVTEVTWRATKVRTKAGNFLDRAEQRRREGNRDELFGADAGDAAGGGRRRELRRAAERREGGHRPRAAERAAARAGTRAGSAHRRFRGVGRDLSRPRVDHRFRGRSAHPRPGPVADLLRVPAQQHRDSVPASRWNTSARWRHRRAGEAGAGYVGRRRVSSRH